MSEKKSFSFDSLRLPLAMVLSLGVVLAYLYYDKKQSDAAAENLKKSGYSSTNSTVAAPTPNAVTKPTAAETSKPAVRALIASGVPDKSVVLENEFLQVQFSSRGGAMVSNVLKDRQNIKSRNLINFEEAALPGYESGILALGTDPSQISEPTPYLVTESTASSVTFRTTVEVNGQKLGLTKRYELKKHTVELDLRIDNVPENPKGILQGSLLLLNGSSIGPAINHDDKTQFDVLTMAYITDGKYETALQPGIGSGIASFFSSAPPVSYQKVPAPAEWIALHNRFFMKGLKPAERKYQPVFFNAGPVTNHSPVSAYEVPYQVSEGKPSTHRFTYYYLPKNRSLLNKYYDETGTQFFQIFEQWDITRFIATPFYYFILWIHKLLPSFGFAILIVTLLLKLATWPLTQKSLVSMQKMQQLTPKMDEIRKKYKNDSQKVNAEMMALYRKEKINPASGCLPMLIPIPIFIALYSLFRSMVELDQETFLWIKDLALPDTVYRLPFNIPLGIGHNLNILPIIMTITSYLQSFTTPQTATSESQKQQMVILKWGMPIMFLFILWNMPSALVLFWTLQNLFSWIQAIVTRKPKLSVLVAKK